MHIPTSSRSVSHFKVLHLTPFEIFPSCFFILFFGAPHPLLVLRFIQLRSFSPRPPEEQQSRSPLRSAVWECVASCRRDWRWPGLLGPHCKLLAGALMGTLQRQKNGRKCLPPTRMHTREYTHTQTRTHVRIPRRHTARTTLCVCPR